MLFRSRPDLNKQDLALVGIGDDALPALLAAAADERVKRLAIAGSAHSLISQMRSRPMPSPGKLGESWNDPQLRGRISLGDDEIDFGSVIPSALFSADIPELASVIAPGPLLFCQARDLAAPDISKLKDRFQKIAVAASNSVRYEPARRFDAALLVEWLTQTDLP